MSNWIPLKQWLAERALESNITPEHAWSRCFKQGQWAVAIKRKNKRVILVDADSARKNWGDDSLQVKWSERVGRLELYLRMNFLARLAQTELEFARKLGYADIPTWK